MAIARFIDHSAFQVQNGRSDGLLAWLTENETRLLAAFPPALQWLGCYTEVIAGDSSGLWHLLIGADRYGALDDFVTTVRDPASDLGPLIGGLLSFFNLSNESKGGRWLYRAAPDVVVWENQ